RCLSDLRSSPTRRSSDLPELVATRTARIRAAGPAAKLGDRRTSELDLEAVGVGEIAREREGAVQGRQQDLLERVVEIRGARDCIDRKSTRLNSSHVKISY